MGSTHCDVVTGLEGPEDEGLGFGPVEVDERVDLRYCGVLLGVFVGWSWASSLNK